MTSFKGRSGPPLPRQAPGECATGRGALSCAGMTARLIPTRVANALYSAAIVLGIAIDLGRDAWRYWCK